MYVGGSVRWYFATSFFVDRQYVIGHVCAQSFDLLRRVCVQVFNYCFSNCKNQCQLTTESDDIEMPLFVHAWHSQLSLPHLGITKTEKNRTKT